MVCKRDRPKTATVRPILHLFVLSAKELRHAGEVNFLPQPPTNNQLQHPVEALVITVPQWKVNDADARRVRSPLTWPLSQR
eukprot:1456037-Alexandrium_andersonii.AAC.1